uniref:FAR1 domain-containing protein n=1 Tax=Lactuca sativa TaxID=4236 RepID=A0A9R1VR92_LACSA|nr:hypothetical protein LSAT_V11C400223630 [Lactuca sativa]
MSTRCVSKFYKSKVLHDIKPDVSEEFKPTKSMRFKDVLEGVNFYKRYTEKVGFNVRMNTLRKDGNIIKHIYVVCNRMGKPKMNLMEHNIIYRVTKFKAKSIVKRVKETCEYRFDKFQEMHNYELEDTFHFKISTSLSYSDKEFIVWASTMKMGATKAYKLKSTLKYGFEHIKGKAVDYINFNRDMGSIIGFKDTQLIMNKKTDRKNNYLNYSFVFYRYDEKSSLKSNIKHTTVNLEMLCRLTQLFIQIMFVQLAVIDHHKSSVIVGAGL